jgi:NAD(P)-dependent dehydrogenase (short-subunit alcohol dehydrogenase family)
MSTMPKGTIVVTGASSGIGAAAASALTALGFDVVALVRDRSRAPVGARETFCVDLSDLADVARVGRELAERLPRIDVLINNAGSTRSRNGLHRMGCRSWWPSTTSLRSC